MPVTDGERMLNGTGDVRLGVFCGIVYRLAERERSGDGRSKGAARAVGADGSDSWRSEFGKSFAVEQEVNHLVADSVSAFDHHSSCAERMNDSGGLASIMK